MCNKETFQRREVTLGALALGAIILVGTMAALNGGTALTASVWDGLKTTLQGMLGSTWVLALAMISLIAAVWQIAHGRGYGLLSVVLGLLAVAIIGPTFVTSVATTTQNPPAIYSIQHSAALKALK